MHRLFYSKYALYLTNIYSILYINFPKRHWCADACLPDNYTKLFLFPISLGHRHRNDCAKIGDGLFARVPRNIKPPSPSVGRRFQPLRANVESESEYMALA